MEKVLGTVKVEKVLNKNDTQLIGIQKVGDNSKQIEELLLELNIIDYFDNNSREKFIELGLGLSLHKGTKCATVLKYGLI
jgi:hypothetical protein